jgi:two-component system, response regulator YesN
LTLNCATANFKMKIRFSRYGERIELITYGRRRRALVSTLLLVDDEAHIREGILAEIDWKGLGVGLVDCADDGVHAMAAAERLLPDILLTDVRMPRMNGIELSRKVREFLPSCQIVFMSGFSDKEYLKSAIDVSAVGYVEKPIDLVELSAHVERAVERSDSERRRDRERASLRDKLSVSLPALSNEVALRLCRRALRADKILEQLRAAAPELRLDSLYATILVEVTRGRSTDSRDALVRLSAIRDIMESMLRSRGYRGVSGFSAVDSCVVAHVCVPGFRSEDPAAGYEAEKLRSSAADALRGEADARVYIGKMVKGILDVGASYESAVRAMGRGFYHRGPAALSPTCPEGKPFAFDPSVVERLLALVPEGDIGRIIAFVRDLAAEIEARDYTPVPATKMFFAQLIRIFSKSGERMGLVVADREAIGEAIERAGDLNELTGIVIETIERAFSGTRSADRGPGVAKSMTEFIAEKHADPRLSLDMVASAHALSSSYTCVIFKEATGKTVNQFIKEYRIGMAKGMLSAGSAKIKDIAAAVGYPDSNYFSKIFREETGLTPVEYRRGFS